MSDVRERQAQRRLAARRMFFDGRGRLNRDGKLLVAYFKRFCRQNESPAQYSPQSGMIDTAATQIAIGRQEVFKEFERLLLLDPVEVYNAREDE